MTRLLENQSTNTSDLIIIPVLTEMSSVLLMCVDMNVCLNVVLTFG